MKLSIVTGVTVVGLTPLRMFAGPAPDLARLPFELHERYQVVVRGTIGPIDGLRFLVDTGSNPTMVDKKIAKRLGLNVQAGETVAFGDRSRTSTAILPSIRIGPVAARDLIVTVGEISFLCGVDAIIGLDLLARTSFSIDYDERTVLFGPVGRAEPGVPLDATPPFLTAAITIAGRPFRLLVDTGSTRLVLFRDRVRDRLPPVSAHGELVLRHFAGTFRLTRVLLRSVEFGSLKVDRLEGFFLDSPAQDYPPQVDGILGLRALPGKSAVFDFDRSRLVIGD